MRYVRGILTSLMATLALAVVYFVTLLATSLGWFTLADANPKIGPEDIGVPLIVFHLVTTGLAAGVVGLLAAVVANPHRGKGAIIIGTVAITALVVSAYVLLGGHPDQNPFHAAVASISAMGLRLLSARTLND